MTFFRGRPDISQIKIKSKIQKFLTLQNRDADFIDQFSEGKGYCAGFACLALYARWLQFQPHDDKNADDWAWMKHVLTLLSSWNEENKNKNIMPNNTFEIERLISLIEYFQRSYAYQPIEQGAMHMTVEDTQKRKLKCVYSVALCLKSEDFTKFLFLGDQKTSLLNVLTQEKDSLVLIDSYDHVTGLLRHGDNFYFYDANCPSGFIAYSRQKAKKLVTTILKAQDYDSNNQSPFPFSFRVFSFQGKTPTYPSQQDLLAKLEPALSPQQGDWDDRTSLHTASEIGCTSSVEYYLKQKANVNVRMKEGITPLYIAAQTGHTEIVELLLKAKADVNAAKTSGATPLFIAAQNDYVAIAKLLLKAKADVNAARRNGETPLFIAAQNGHTEVVELLLKAGADVNAKTKDGKTALDIAKNAEIKRLLTQAAKQKSLAHRVR